jgi:hypothetical protein
MGLEDQFREVSEGGLRFHLSALGFPVALFLGVWVWWLLRIPGKLTPSSVN